MILKLRIITFNLRFENDTDGPHAWKFRKRAVIELIKEYAPSILGTQEGRPAQLDFLTHSLSDYIANIPSSRRIDDATCQFPTLYFRNDLFDIVESDEFWLSLTPSVHRSKDWGSAFPRMINFARLIPKGTNESFWVAVTHLDNKNAFARQMQAGMIVDWVQKRTGNIILMGDFNERPGSNVHRLLTSHLIDTWEAVNMPEDRDSFTYHGFTGIPRQSRMDWILVSKGFQVERALIIKDKFQDRYPSDHFPYLSDIKITCSL